MSERTYTYSVSFSMVAGPNFTLLLVMKFPSLIKREREVETAKVKTWVVNIVDMLLCDLLWYFFLHCCWFLILFFSFFCSICFPLSVAFRVRKCLHRNSDISGWCFLGVHKDNAAVHPFPSWRMAISTYFFVVAFYPILLFGLVEGFAILL